MITPEQIAAAGTEDAHQKALLCWSALNVKKYPALQWLFHCPNGGSRNIIEAGKLKAMGVKRGVPDLILPVVKATAMGVDYYALFIELKISTGVVSAEQKKWLAHLNDNGYCAKVCWSWIEARDLLVWYLT